jgi:hypothetical protein
MATWHASHQIRDIKGLKNKKLIVASFGMAGGGAESNSSVDDA